MFKLIALILLVHAWNVARNGRVTISEGMVSRVVTRHDSPALIWFHCGAYMALAFALVLLP
jgi:hypothetical protein